MGLEVATGGGFALNIVSANLNAYQAGSLVPYLTDVWTLMPLVLATVAAFLLPAPWFLVPPGGWSRAVFWARSARAWPSATPART